MCVCTCVCKACTVGEGVTCTVGERVACTVGDGCGMYSRRWVWHVQ